MKKKSKKSPKGNAGDCLRKRAHPIFSKNTNVDNGTRQNIVGMIKRFYIVDMCIFRMLYISNVNV